MVISHGEICWIPFWLQTVKFGLFFNRIVITEETNTITHCFIFKLAKSFAKIKINLGNAAYFLLSSYSTIHLINLEPLYNSY